jgi:uncharacterized NAD(P)/FAD-binding protein YdhS
VTAAQILRKAEGSVEVALIERGEHPGKGVAYGTQCDKHLLNVPAKNMSAFPDDAEHLLRWARSNHDAEVKPGDFIPRQVYGRYVASILQNEIEKYPGQFEHVRDEAVAVDERAGGAVIRLRSGHRVFAQKVVLALGNFRPSDPRMPGKAPKSERYASNPWAPGALGEAAQAKSILLVGTGLTSVDVGIGLREQGFTGTIHVLSRRGLLPQTHKAAPTWPAFWSKQSPRTARGLLRLVRSQVAEAEAEGADWRPVVDSLRPFTQEIWRTLPAVEQRRFLRHVRPYWDVHRHRVAQEIGGPLAEELMSGRTRIHAGRIEGYREDAQGAEIAYRDRSSGERRQLRVERVINCTGPESDYRRLDDEFLQSLLSQKLARADALFLGLAVAPNGALLGADGEASEIFYTLGPGRKGTLWETTAVPEIRVQAAELAGVLVQAGLAERKGVESAKEVEAEAALG